MVGRNPARYLAPIALAAIVAGTYVIVHDHLGASATKQATVQTGTQISPVHRRYARASSYTVQPGDTLTHIASKTGVSLTTLEQLNPSLNPDSLQTGQRIRLRR
jgi:LysM repeat protein